MKISNSKKIIFIWLIFTAFRLFYSQQNDILHNEAEKKIYSIGLDFFVTGEWPYYGSPYKIIENTETNESGKKNSSFQINDNPQIPGALLGLLVGLPFYLFPHPSSPIIFLVLLVSASLGIFAWYLSQKEFKISEPFLWVWTMTIPYTMYYGIRLDIWSYVLPFTILFFIALIELLPLKDSKALPNRWSFGLMGFSLMCILQLHLSGFILIAPVITTFLFHLFPITSVSWKIFSKKIAFFLVGAFLGSITLFPTLLFQNDSLQLDKISQAFMLHWDHSDELLNIVIYLFYLPSYEMGLNQTIFQNLSSKIQLALEYSWVLPAIVFITLFGWAQIICYLICLLFPTGFHRVGWDRIRAGIILVVVLIWISYFFYRDIDFYKNHILFLPFIYYFSLYVNEWILGSYRHSRHLFYVVIFAWFFFYLAVGMKEKSQPNHIQPNLEQAIKNKNLSPLKSIRFEKDENSKLDDHRR